jgi:hypothetical protein
MVAINRPPTVSLSAVHSATVGQPSSVGKYVHCDDEELSGAAEHASAKSSTTSVDRGAIPVRR